MDARDVALQSVMPTVMVPRFSELEELSVPGNRILVASNGVWLEVRRVWMYARIPIAPALRIPVPYGEVSEVLRFGFGKLPRAMAAQFIEMARTRCPNECAVWIVWNQRTDAWKLVMLEETSVGHGHVNVNLPTLENDEHMIVDLHSHGLDNAFFSRTDNKDDRRNRFALRQQSAAVHARRKAPVIPSKTRYWPGLHPPRPVSAQA